MVAILCWPALDAIAQPTSGVQGRAERERERAKLSFSLCVLCSRGFAAREPPGNLIPLIFSSFFSSVAARALLPTPNRRRPNKIQSQPFVIFFIFFYSKIVDVIHVNINSLSLHNARTLLQLRPRSRKETTRRRRNGNTQAQMEGR